MTGLECLSFIRAQGLSCEVVLLSGYDDYALIRQALKLNVLDYMLKPVHIDSLVRLVSDLLPKLKGRTFSTAKDEQTCQPALHAMPYFDISVAEPLDENGLNQALEDFMRSMQAMQPQEMESALKRFFDGNDGSVMDEPSTKNALIRCVYQLMERIPAMIHIIAESKLTHYDAVSSIKNLPTLSQLRDRMVETFLYNTEQLKRDMEKRDQYLIAQAKEYIACHYMENPTLEELASKFHMNAAYFSTLFRQLSGVTFREYLRTERIAQAQHLIREGDCKLYEVAERVGYQNASHFNRAFKEVTGVTPSMWALHNRNKHR